MKNIIATVFLFFSVFAFSQSVQCKKNNEGNLIVKVDNPKNYNFIVSYNLEEIKSSAFLGSKTFEMQVPASKYRVFSFSNHKSKELQLFIIDSEKDLHLLSKSEFIAFQNVTSSDAYEELELLRDD